MAILAADSTVSMYGEGLKVPMPCTGADIFYKGAIVWSDTSGGTGLAQVGSLAAGDRVLGICAEQTTTTAAGDLVPVYIFGAFEFPAMTNVTGADVGDWCVFDVSASITDNPADCVASGDITLAVNDAVVGKIVSYVNSRAIVQLGNWTGAIYGTDATTVCFI